MPTDNPSSLRVEDLHPDPDQPRKHFCETELETLAESVRRHGVLQPIRVRHVRSRWVIIDGHRRWLSAKRAGLTHVPVIVESREIGVAETAAQSLSADVVRSELNAIERGEAIKRIMELSGKPASEVCRDTGISEANASKLLAILLLPEPDKQRVRDGTLGLAAAYRLAKGKRRPPMEPRRSVSGVPPARPKPVRIALAKGTALLLGSGAPRLDVLADTLIGFADRIRAAHSSGVASIEGIAHE